MALATKVNELSAMTKKTNENRSKYGPIADWQKKKENPVIEKEGLIWYWCPNYSGKDCNGSHVCHKLEDCRMKHKMGKQEKFNTPKQADLSNNKQNMKLTLQKELKTALLAIGTFTEDQVDSILNKAQECMSKDF